MKFICRTYGSNDSDAGNYALLTLKPDDVKKLDARRAALLALKKADQELVSCSFRDYRSAQYYDCRTGEPLEEALGDVKHQALMDGDWVPVADDFELDAELETRTENEYAVFFEDGVEWVAKCKYSSTAFETRRMRFEDLTAAAQKQ